MTKYIAVSLFKLNKMSIQQQQQQQPTSKKMISKENKNGRSKC